MCNLRLWISFYTQDKKTDQWTLCLEDDSDGKTDCHIWQLRGEPYEYTTQHIHDIRPESLVGFKDKWLIRDNLTNHDGQVIREIASHHPVDNEAYYWDCRVYCFEILGLLETQAILDREDKTYRAVRQSLHRRWKVDHGVSSGESEEDEEDGGEGEVDGAGSNHGPDRALNTKLVPSGQRDAQHEEEGEEDKVKVREQHACTQDLPSTNKRTLSHGSEDVARPLDPVRLQDRAPDPRKIKRQKDE